MVTLPTTVTTTVLASISPEESNDGTPVLSLPSPLKKMRKTSHQHQIDRQNERKGKDAYALALSRATTLIATEREQEKENTRPTATVITQVEGEFKARGFAVKLTKSTVNRYVWRGGSGGFYSLRHCGEYTRAARGPRESNHARKEVLCHWGRAYQLERHVYFRRDGK